MILNLHTKASHFAVKLAHELAVQNESQYKTDKRGKFLWKKKPSPRSPAAVVVVVELRADRKSLPLVSAKNAIN